jgi:hypothetical protein
LAAGSLTQLLRAKPPSPAAAEATTEAEDIEPA